MKVVVDRNLCIGAAPCVAIAGSVFQMDDEGKAIVIDAHGADDQTIMLATQACPVLAIFLYDEADGRQLFPAV